MDTLRLKDTLYRTVAIVAASAGAVACSGVEQKVEDPYCSFSPDTTVAEIAPGSGKQNILLQISGVDLGTCLSSAESYVESLNGQQIDSPKWDDTVVIPVSAQFHPGS